MSSVDNLRAIISQSNGVAKGNKYRVSLLDGDSNKLNILCDSINFPGRQITTQDYLTNMKTRKMPYAFENEDITITFLLGNDWYAWDYLKDWQNSIINKIDGVSVDYTVNFRSQYTRQVTIDHLDDNNNIRKTIKIFNAFPTSLNSIELSNASENTALRCTATFSYDNWDEGDTPPAPIIAVPPRLDTLGFFAGPTTV